MSGLPLLNKMKNNKKIVEFHSAAKAVLYFGASLFTLLVLLSNSITAVLKTIWRDVGNNWAVGWEYLEMRLSPFQLYVLGVFVVPSLLYWLYGTLFMFFDLQEGPTILTRYKVQPEKNEPVDREKLWICIKTVLFNQVAVSGPVALSFYFLFIWRGCSFSLPLPSFNGFLFQMALCIFIEETLFYYSHRLLHVPYFYGRVHKQHHQWTAPVGLAAIYCHPVEHIFSNLLPVLGGPFIIGAHFAVTTVWLSIAILNTIHVHSGYHIPFFPSPQSHDWHHLRFNENYGVLGLFDYIHGTDTMFRKSVQFQRHRVFLSLDEYYSQPSTTEKKENDAVSK